MTDATEHRDAQRGGAFEARRSDDGSGPGAAGGSIGGSMPAEWIVPAWPAPPSVRALMTTRDGGVSDAPWGARSSHAGTGGMNLGLGSGDARDAVEANRRILQRHVPGRLAWLRQVHGIDVVDAATAAAAMEDRGEPLAADASWSATAGPVCAILVADCMPVLFANRQGTRVAAAHAGWRGLAAGVLEATLAASGLIPAETLAWIGPAIGPSRFEVGADVRDAFIGAAGATRDAVDAAFVPAGPEKWLADLPQLARLRLAAGGVDRVFASELCTMSDPCRFYSYRRDGVTGRMVALIWLDH